MVSDKQVEQPCVWVKRKTDSGYRGGSEALVLLVTGLELTLGQLHPGESVCPWDNLEVLHPQGILSIGSPEPSLRRKAPVANGLVIFPTSPTNQHPGFRLMGEGSVSESPSPSSISSRMIVTDHEKDHSASSHLQPSKRRGS